MIKEVLTSAAIAASATTVSAQDIQQVPFVGVCSLDFSAFENVYGDGLAPIHEPLKNGGGIGIAIMENDDYQVGMLFTPSGAMCVIWDNVLDGDPS